MAEPAASPDNFELHLRELHIDKEDHVLLGTLTRRNVERLKMITLEDLKEKGIESPVARDILGRIAKYGAKKTPWQQATYKNLEPTTVTQEEVYNHVKEIGGSADFVQTVQTCLRVLADSSGGALILILDQSVLDLQEIPCRFLDQKRFSEVLQSEVKNVREQPEKFAKLLSAFRRESVKGFEDQWDPDLLRELESGLVLELNKLHSLEGVPKDGAVILTIDGDVVAAAVQLMVVQKKHDLIKRNGKPCGCRHAAMVAALELLGLACSRIRVPGIIMAASDAGGIHIGLPIAEDDLKMLYVETLADGVDEKGVCKVHLTLSRTTTATSMRSIPTAPVTPSSTRSSSVSSPPHRKRSTSAPPHGSRTFNREGLLARCDDDPQVKVQEHLPDKVQLNIDFECVTSSEVQNFRLSELNQRLFQTFENTGLSAWLWTGETKIETNPPITLPDEMTEESIRELEDALTQQLGLQLPSGWNRALVRREGCLVLRLPGQCSRELITRHCLSPLKVELPSWCAGAAEGGTVQFEVIDVRPEGRQWWSICCDHQDIPNICLHVRDMAEATFSLKLSFEPHQIGQAIGAVLSSHSELSHAVDEMCFPQRAAKCESAQQPDVVQKSVSEAFLRDVVETPDETLLKDHALNCFETQYARRVRECEVTADDIPLVDLVNSGKMKGVSLSMSEMIIHQVWWDGHWSTPSQATILWQGSRFLCSVATESEVTCEVKEALHWRLLECIVFSEGRCTFAEDLDHVSRILSTTEKDDEYTVIAGSSIVQICLDNAVKQAPFPESFVIPIGAKLTIVFNPMHRLERHFRVEPPQSDQLALFNRVKLSVGRPSLLGPDKILPGLNLGKNTGLAVTYQLERSLAEKGQKYLQVRDALVGPSTEVDSSTSEFLVYCCAVDQSFFSLRAVCRSSSNVEPRCLFAPPPRRGVLDNPPEKVAQRNSLVFMLVRQSMQPPLYTPRLVELAKNESQKLAEVLSIPLSWPPLRPTPQDFKQSEQLRKSLQGVISAHLHGGFSEQAAQQVLKDEVHRLGKLSQQKHFQCQTLPKSVLLRSQFASTDVPECLDPTQSARAGLHRSQASANR